MNDPFATNTNQPADPFADLANAFNTAAQNKETPVTVQSEGKIVLTFKQGTGYDAPWIVVHAADAADAKEQLRALHNEDLMNAVAITAKAFADTKGGNQAPPAPPQSFQQPAASPYQQPTQQTGGGDGRHCSHGEMVFKSGTNKFGKPYSAYFCPTPKGTPGQCQAQFV